MAMHSRMAYKNQVQSSVACFTQLKFLKREPKIRACSACPYFGHDARHVAVIRELISSHSGQWQAWRREMARPSWPAAGPWLAYRYYSSDTSQTAEQFLARWLGVSKAKRDLCLYPLAWLFSGHRVVWPQHSQPSHCSVRTFIRARFAVVINIVEMNA